MEKKLQGSHHGLISDIFVNGQRKTMKNCQDTRHLGFNSGPFEDEARGGAQRLIQFRQYSWWFVYR